MRAFYKTLPTQQPTFITEPSVSNQANTYALSYSYGADYERVKGILTLNGTLQNTRYYLGSYEKNVSASGTEWVHYVSGADGLAAIVTITNAMAPTYHYVFKDHLGSILRVTNAAGTPEADQSFDAWGRRRNPTTWAYTSATAPTQTWLYRGYTAHEHLDQFALINMNGRLYDPTVGRMLSPDNYVQDALYAQTFNRYSYAHNNPLKFTDPDGEFAFVAILTGALIGAATSGGIYSVGAATNGNWNWKDFGRAVAMGAISGALGGTFSSIGVAAGIGQNVGYGIMSNMAGSAATSAIFGEKITAGSLIGSALGGAIGSGIPMFKGFSHSGNYGIGDAIGNIVAELAYNSVRGAVIGGLSGGISAALNGEDIGRGIANGVKNGAIAAGVSSSLNILILGAAIRPNAGAKAKIQRLEEITGVNILGAYGPTFRTGGVWQRGLTTGRSIVIGIDDINTEDDIWRHESVHFVQQRTQTAVGQLGRGMFEQWILAPMHMRSYPNMDYPYEQQYTKTIFGIYYHNEWRAEYDCFYFVQ